MEDEVPRPVEFCREEDPKIHQEFEAALAKSGIVCEMGGAHPFCTGTERISA